MNPAPKPKLYVRFDYLEGPTQAAWHAGPHADVGWDVVAEDGAIVRSGLASSMGWARRDAGLADYVKPIDLTWYEERYPDGFELIEAPGRDPEAWSAVQAARALRAERAA